MLLVSVLKGAIEFIKKSLNLNNSSIEQQNEIMTQNERIIDKTIERQNKIIDRMRE